MHVSRFFIFILVGTFLLLVFEADGLNIGVIPFPEPNRFTPMLAIMKELLIRGHGFEVYVPEEFMSYCLRELKDQCVTVGAYKGSYGNQEALTKTYFNWRWTVYFIFTERSTRKFTMFFESALKITLQKMSAHPDVVLMDIGLWNVEKVLNQYQIPTIFLWSLTQWPGQMETSFTARGGGVSVQMNLIERAKNYLFQWLNDWTTRIWESEVGNSSSSFDIILYERHIITPFVFGIDTSQLYCPNVHHVGFLFPSVERSTDLNNELNLWMNSCSNGILFINLGPTSALPNSWKNVVDQFIDILTEEKSICVLWETYETRNTSLVREGNGMRLKMIGRIPFSSRSILRHGNTKVFLTNCGNFSVYESVESGIPIVGLPLLPEHDDICRRVEDAGIGIVLDNFLCNSHQLFDIVMQVLNNPQIQEKLLSIKGMGHVLGGAKRATDIIERVWTSGKGTDVMFCRWGQLPLIERHDLDIVFILSGVSAVFLIIIMKMCSRGNSAAKSRGMNN